MQLGDTVNLSNDRASYYSTQAHVAPSRKTGSLYVIWHKSKGMFGGGKQLEKDRQNKSSMIVYRVSKDKGATFSKTSLLYSFKDVNSFGLPVAFTSPQHSGGFGDGIFLALVDKTSASKYDVYLSMDSDDGNSLKEPVLVSDSDNGLIGDDDSGTLSDLTVTGKGLSWKWVVPYVANASADKVYVLWAEMKTIKLPSQLDEATKQELEKGFSGSDMSQVRDFHRKMGKAIPRYQIEYEFFFKASNDGGESFGKRINMLTAKGYSPGAPYHIGPMILAASGDNVYIVIDSLGADSANRKVRFYRSNDNGETFQMNELMHIIEGEQKVANSVRASITRPSPTTLYLLETLFSRKTLEQPMDEGSMLMAGFDPPPHTTLIARSEDAGSTFAPLAILENANASPGGTPFVVAEDGKHVYAASIDTGHRFDFMRDLMRGTLTKDRVMQDMRTAEDTLGKVLIRSSNDSGVTFGQPVALADSKHIGAVMEFGVNVLLLPFGSDGLVALKTRNIHRQPTKAGGTDSDTDESSIEESHDSEVIMWVSYDGGITFGEPVTVSGDARNSGLNWGSTIVQEATASAGEQLSRLYLAWEAGTFLGNKDIYIRRIAL